jgi:trehalose 6-phosphate phosphatase
VDFVSAAAERRWDRLVAAAGSTVVGLDFDGTLAPIVDDPDLARIHPEAGDVLVALAEQVAGIAVITGRPVRQALQLGDLDKVGARVHELGKMLQVFGQYGNEQWSAGTQRVVSPRPPKGLASFERLLPRALREADAVDAHIEDKGLAIAVHTRRMGDPAAAFDRLLPRLEALAVRNGLAVEPGKAVIEVRGNETHKGMVVERLAVEADARGFLIAGDDLGDVEAFEAVAALGERGLATVRVCSASEEETALAGLADVLVEGPAGVLDLLRRFTHAAAAARA